MAKGSIRRGRKPKTVTSPLPKKLAAMLVEQRKKAGLRQVDLAEKIGVYQSCVTHMESGQRRIDVLELIALGKAIGFDAAEMVRKLSRR
ncbi:MAG TPA: helix-turn-helix transcriptional regulator [Bradyrhizobium sp.]|jgi:ribosome-binding protein aMBF1 (putative translation factor)|nr:helix-turn-helix transcriptional regulator [Bradyrhizobium sp.]